MNAYDNNLIIDTKDTLYDDIEADSWFFVKLTLIMVLCVLATLGGFIMIG